MVALIVVKVRSDGREEHFFEALSISIFYDGEAVRGPGGGVKVVGGGRFFTNVLFTLSTMDPKNTWNIAKTGSTRAG